MTEDQKIIEMVPGKEGDGEETGFTLDDRIALKELRDNRQKAIEDRDLKCKSAKEHLMDMLRITVDKYRTATGTLEAMRVLRMVGGDQSAQVYAQANKLAWAMSAETEKMHKKAADLDYADMEQLCDGFYQKEFTLTDDGASTAICSSKVFKLAFELMRIDLCRNVGPSAEDMVAFLNRANEEIAKMDEKIADLEKREAESKK